MRHTHRANACVRRLKAPIGLALAFLAGATTLGLCHRPGIAAEEPWPPPAAQVPHYYGPLHPRGEKVLLVLGWVRSESGPFPLAGSSYLSLYRVERLPAPIWVRAWQEEMFLTAGFQVLNVPGARSRLLAAYWFGVSAEGLAIYDFSGKERRPNQVFHVGGKIPPVLARENGRWVVVERSNLARMVVFDTSLPWPLPAGLRGHVFVRRTDTYSRGRNTFVPQGDWQPDLARERALSLAQMCEERAGLREAIRRRQR